MLWLWFARGARGPDLGLTLTGLADDVRCGAVAFALVVVPIYFLQAVLTQFFPSHHPLIELLQKSNDAGTIVMAATAAALVAPVVEEFLFRLVLQGGLEAAAAASQAAIEPVARPDAGANDFDPSATLPAVAETLDVVESSENPYQSTVREAGQPASGQAAPAAVWPIMVSAGLFALLHWQHGPDPIPLFVLAVALGYVYQRTHRIVPSIVVHLLLNSTTLAVMWLSGGAAQ